MSTVLRSWLLTATSLRTSGRNPRAVAATAYVPGAIGVVQLDHEVDMAAATKAAVEAGVWLRPFRDLVYTMPPYVCTDEDITAISRGVVAAAAASYR